MVDGHEWYFRSRGSRWSIEIGDWKYTEPYGVWPEAGYMVNETAVAMIAKAIARWRAEQ